jgi:hypothetical protein
MASKPGDNGDNRANSSSRTLHEYEQDVHELRRRGQAQKSRGSAVYVLLDKGRASQVIEDVGHGRVKIDVTALLSSLNASPTWNEWAVGTDEDDERLTIADAAAVVGMSAGALRQRVWRARQKGEWTPFVHSGPSDTFTASKRELIEWKATWVGKHKVRSRVSGDINRPA